ncbi:MAG: hypothetical protein FJZ87_04590 [Chloroflexi bacterium]|nr:hypothetical protein [Chloroflexota bacterium]
MMKSPHILNFSILILITLTGVLILSAFQPPARSSSTIISPHLPAQVTVTPIVQDMSEIGSTDGIVGMGILITFITITPLLLRRRK